MCAAREVAGGIRNVCHLGHSPFEYGGVERLRVKILIAEDDTVTRVHLKAMLEKLGHEVLDAEDGEQALEIHQHERVRVVVSEQRLHRLIAGCTVFLQPVSLLRADS